MKILDIEKCCGCSACVNICPTQAVTLKKDVSGFLIPEVNSLCINCRLCEKACPVLNRFEKHQPLAVYAARSKHTDVLKSSTSGGVFAEIARLVILSDGVVCGAGWEKGSWSVEHRCVEDIAGLVDLSGSKYVQSQIGGAFKQVKSLLESGRLVLFSGTPCQIAGLKCFLSKDYENLLLVSIMCFGVPSPDVWDWYLRDLAIKYGSRISSVNFRRKRENSKTDLTVIEFADSSKVLEEPFPSNAYARIYFSKVVLRKCCFDCEFRCGSSGADIVLGDYWGVEYYHPRFADRQGTNAVLILSSKGLRYFQRLKLDKEKTSYEFIIRGNPCLTQRRIKTNRKRERRWKQVYRKVNFTDAVCYTLRMNFFEIFSLKVRNIIKRTLEVFNRR